MKFQIGQQLRNTISGEQGECRGRAEYTPELGQPQYHVYFKDSQGTFTRDWWPEGDVQAVETPTPVAG